MSGYESLLRIIDNESVMLNGKAMRFGLCCIFSKEDITFKSRQAGYIGKFTRDEQLDLLSTTILHNATSLMLALRYCAAHDIGSFRVNSGILPLKSHPQLRYELHELPEYTLISELFAAAKAYSGSRNIRLTFHPDQFTLLSSPRVKVTHQSFAELDYHAEVAEWIGADVIILHGGGAYGDKPSALARVESNIAKLPKAVRTRLALENDDRVYTPRDLLPLCERSGVPFVYDVHHHRCLDDELSVEEVTIRALKTWNREPLFHLSSPKNGWQAPNVRPHHDYINLTDMPAVWLGLEITVEVEAKAKELAIAKLQQEMRASANATGDY